MKKVHTDIHELIHSMSASECRYFILYCKRHYQSDTAGLLLFQYIRKQAMYDEMAIRAAFKTYSWISHLPVIKKQLYTQILLALHQFDEYNNPLQDIIKGIHYCRILFRKGLYKQCMKLLLTYKQKAHEMERYEYVFELIEIQKKLIQKLYDKDSENMFNTLYNEGLHCLHTLESDIKFNKHADHIYHQHIIKKITPGNPGKEFETLVKKYPISTTTQKKIPLRIFIEHLQIHALYAFIQKNFLKAYNYNSRFISLLDSKPILRRLYADRYFSVYNNLLIDALLLKKYKDLFDGIAHLNTLPHHKDFKVVPDIDLNVFRLVSTLKLNYYIHSDKIEEASKDLIDIERGLSRYQKKLAIPSRTTLYYLCAYVYFFTTDFKACLHALDAILQNKESMQITDLYRDARMMQIYCHFELQHDQLLDSLIISFQRMLHKSDTKQRSYQAMIRYIKPALAIDRFSKTALRIELESILQEGKEAQRFNNFNFMKYLQFIRKR